MGWPYQSQPFIDDFVEQGREYKVSALKKGKQIESHPDNGR